MSSRRKPSIDFSKLYYPSLQREFVPELLKRHGDFLLRRAGNTGRVLSVMSNGELMHFRFSDVAKTYNMEGQTYDSLEAMISHYYLNEKKWAGKDNVVLLNPITNTVDLIDYGRLKFVQELGRGNFGEVWRASLMPGEAGVTDEEVAIKILSQNSSDEERAECMAEARLMSGLQHENVVRLKGMTFWKPDEATPTKMLIVLEYCNLGSLDKLLQKDMVGRKGKEHAIVDSARGLVYLHDQRIIHRDLATRNCLVKSSGNKFTVKVADFGLSRQVATTYKLVTKRRLPVFSTPPDTLKTRSWTIASDVWSFGILMQEVYNGGKNPYEKHYGKTPLKQVVTELSAGTRVPTPESMPPALAQLSLRCLSHVSERPLMSEVLEQLTRLVDQSRREEVHV